MFGSCIVMVVLGVIALIVVVALYKLYVELIQKKNKVKEAMGGIDVQLNMKEA